MSAHTPGPWHCNGPNECEVIAPNRRTVCRTDVDGDYNHHYERMSADAQRIVTAVNAHDDLVAALRIIASYTGNDEAAWVAQKLASAALARVGL